MIKQSTKSRKIQCNSHKIPDKYLYTAIPTGYHSQTCMLDASTASSQTVLFITSTSLLAETEEVLQKKLTNGATETRLHRGFFR